MTRPALAKRPEAFVETAIDDEIVLLDLKTGDFFSLAGSALAIWRLIDGTRGRDAILAALAEEYTAAPADLAGDLDDFLTALAGAGYLAGS